MSGERRISDAIDWDAARAIVQRPARPEAPTLTDLARADREATTLRPPAALRIPVVYVAGPYTAKTPWETEQHIQAARRAGAEVAKLGAVPLIPHTNTAHFGGLQPDEWWYPATLELLRRCDAVLLVEGWERSRGARGEHDEARLRGMPVFSSVETLAWWVQHFVADVGETGT